MDPRHPIERVVDYHQASKHHLHAYAPGPGGLDWATQPKPFRFFPGAKRVELPLRANTLQTTFEDVRIGNLDVPKPLTMEALATLLEVSVGISAWKQSGQNRWALRCNPSSGNLHPTEVYLVTARRNDLDAGVYHYNAHDHVLEKRATPEQDDFASELGEGILVLLTSVVWREAWKYGLRAYRYCQHDCGHAIASFSYAAHAVGVRQCLLPAFSDDEISMITGIDRAADYADAEPEEADVAFFIGQEPPSKTLDRAKLTQNLVFHGKPTKLSPNRVHWGGIVDVAEAARKPNQEGILHERFVPDPLPPLSTSPCTKTAATLLRQRRSAVDFDGKTRLSSSAFFGMLDALLPRQHVPPFESFPFRPRIHPVIFAHRIDDVDPGLYLLCRDPQKQAELKQAFVRDWSFEPVENAPPHLPLTRLARCDAREAAKIVSCHQDIAADSCFAIGFLAEFTTALADGPWTYRELFWEAGLLGQILYLEAEAHGVRATGIGCYFDDAVHHVLGLQGIEWQSLYHFTVGGPVEDPRIQSLPAYDHLGKARLNQ